MARLIKIPNRGKSFGTYSDKQNQVNGLSCRGGSASSKTFNRNPLLMFKFLIVAFFIFMSAASAEVKVKKQTILFIGNSFTSRIIEQVNNTFKNESAAFDSRVFFSVKGGVDIHWHSRPSDRTREFLFERNLTFDHIILQEQSKYMLLAYDDVQYELGINLDEGEDFKSIVDKSLGLFYGPRILKGYSRMFELIKQSKSKNAMIHFYQTAGTLQQESFSPGYHLEHTRKNRVICESLKKEAQRQGFKANILNVGDAWEWIGKSVSEELEKKLYNSRDLYHPSNQMGAYVTAAKIYSDISDILLTENSLLKNTYMPSFLDVQQKREIANAILTMPKTLVSENFTDSSVDKRNDGFRLRERNINEGWKAAKQGGSSAWAVSSTGRLENNSIVGGRNVDFYPDYIPAEAPVAQSFGIDKFVIDDSHTKITIKFNFKVPRQDLLLVSLWGHTGTYGNNSNIFANLETRYGLGPVKRKSSLATFNLIKGRTSEFSKYRPFAILVRKDSGVFEASIDVRDLNIPGVKRVNDLKVLTLGFAKFEDGKPGKTWVDGLEIFSSSN